MRLIDLRNIAEQGVYESLSTKDVESFSSSYFSVLTLGSFDGFHRGHGYLIEDLLRAKQELELEISGSDELNRKTEDIVSLVVQFDPHPREVLMGEMVSRLSSETENLTALREMGVDFLCLLTFDPQIANKTATEFIENYLIDLLGMKSLVLGYDHSFGKNRDATDTLLNELAQKHSFAFRRQSELTDEGAIISSSSIRKMIEEGKVENAAKFLGRPFQLSGEIMEGKRRGRTIGFPTANLQIDDERKILPRLGVYLVLGESKQGFKAYGMLNVGTRPTVSDEDRISIETFFFNSTENLYGSDMRLSFIKRLRDEKKFNSIEELKEQLNKDQADCISYIESLS